VISLLLAETQTHHFAFRREDVESVLLLPRLGQHPGDIPLIEGWLQLRGESLPVISLATALGVGEEPPRLSDRLVLTSLQPRVAWRVRQVGSLGEITWEELRLLEHSAEPTPCYVAVFQHEGHDVHLLNVSGLLMVEEQERLRQAEQRRAERLERLERLEPLEQQPRQEQLPSPPEPEPAAPKSSRRAVRKKSHD
jgi:chemotaxis signal transduction protein